MEDTFSRDTSLRTWIRLAALSGLASTLCYFGAAFVPMPDWLVRLLAFAFGPLLSIAFLGIYRFLATHHDGPVLQIACLFGLIAGVLVTSMLVVQVGNNMVRADLMASAESDAARETIRLSWGAVNRVQYLLDVVWDIFICAATVLLGVSMLSHPRFGKIWGSLGIASGLLLLVLNLHTFPTAPAEAGSVDLGPLVALWMTGVFARMWFIHTPEPAR